MSKVLVLGCGTQGLIMVRELNRAGHEVYLLGEKNNYADSSRYVKSYYHTLNIPSSAEYLSEVLSIIKARKIEVLIPMGDVHSEFMSSNKNTLLSYVRFEMPDLKDYLRGSDKNELMKLCQAKGYPHPFTVNTVNDIHILDKNILSFPLLIKPNITCGGRGMLLVYSYEELLDKYPQIREQYGDCHLQKYVKPGGAQVEVQLYVNKNKQLVNSSVIYKYRWYPEKGGSSCCAKSVKNDEIVNILYKLLIDLNWVGFADFDTIEDPDTGDLLIMELNPRVPACVKCAFEAGVNWAQIIVDAYLNKPQKQYNYNEGEYLRHLGFEILWFIKSKNRFKTRPSWFNFWGKHIHYQDMSDWSDPKPFIMGTFNNVKKVLTHKEKERIVR